jgi:hypothetical protein
MPFWYSLLRLYTWKSASYQLSDPWAASFDSAGNIFVSDQGNNRIQKFSLLTDSSGKYTKPF